MKILHVSPTYYPATFWGGPIFSTKAICDAVSITSGMEVEVLTTDAAGLRLSERVSTSDFPNLGYNVYYARRIAGHSISPGLLIQLWHAMHRADVVHLTGAYSFPTLPVLMLARFIGKPLIWSPRGAVQATVEWAESPRKWIKHRFHRIARRVVPERCIIHTTSEAERRATLAALPGVAGIVIPNAVTIPDFVNEQSHERDSLGLKLIFLSRLHPKKGIDRLLDAMRHLPTSTTLDIYGTGDSDYVAIIRKRASEFGGRVRLHGHVEGAGKAAAFARADLFVLPTFSENFGIAIAEAMAHGLPILTTTATPWHDMERYNCGRCIDPNGDIAAAILSMERADLRRMGKAGRDWMLRDFSTEAMANSFVDLYRSLASSLSPEKTGEARRR